jgi:(1->4)-alpha-D-glucan 1-alpha-D-glucosylmutase
MLAPSCVMKHLVKEQMHMNAKPYAVPRATYRLQFNKNFTFIDAQGLAPYLARLGVSHAYLSPILKARPGSTHGYDTVDHTMINPELGTLDEFRDMALAFRKNGLGIVLDFVPNHMGIGGDENPYWLDVLEWGRASRYADWFDIDWTPPEPMLHNKVLVPFLGQPYGKALAEGELQLKFDADEGSLAIWANQANKLPLHPRTYAQILSQAGTDIASLCAPLSTPEASYQEANALKAALRQLYRTDAEGAIDRAIAAVNGNMGDSESWKQLDHLIAGQNWRVSAATAGADELNYRRFFTVSDLAAIRIENDVVFDHAHALIFQLIEEGLIDGLRIDHIDGLRDPKAYCLKLREKAPRPIYLLVEKILAPHEMLRMDWEVDGTTGYEFSGAVMRLLTDPAGEAAMDQAYRSFVGPSPSFDEIERVSKLGIIDNEMEAELAALGERLLALARGNRTSSDFTRHTLKRALRQIVACMPIYRTYVDGGPRSAIDARNIGVAIAEARKLEKMIAPSVFEFLCKVMTGELAAEGYDRDAVLDIARRIQQYTGPVMAKGLEDTALYRFNRLSALSDVGAKPDRFSSSIAAFHGFNAARLRHFPDAMLTTSSHDTKRGEDNRVRIVTLSGHADEWLKQAKAWLAMLDKADAPAIEPSDAYHFFQLLLGAWPAEFSHEGALDMVLLKQFCERIDAAMLKSIREARMSTNWIIPDKGYEKAIAEFVAMALAPGGAFLASFRNFEARLAWEGAQNGLIATVLKLTVPGVPDIYQGSELWEQSMVDPDNRRLVDFATRQAQIGAELSGGKRNWNNGGIKQRLIADILGYRTRHEDLFRQGSYEPLEVDDRGSQQICAFRRQLGETRLVVAVRLFPWRNASESAGDIRLPDGERLATIAGADYSDRHGSTIDIGRAFAELPFLVLGSP